RAEHGRPEGGGRGRGVGDPGGRGAAGAGRPGGRERRVGPRARAGGPPARPRRGGDRVSVAARPDEHGRFGAYGGRYAPEVLIPALDELTDAWLELRDDPGFRGELTDLLRNLVGRPTPITRAIR